MVIPESQKNELELLSKKIRHCTKCRLWQSRCLAVPGEGNYLAEIMLVGEGPGNEEDKCGRPFVGKAGKFLDELLLSVLLVRTDLFITNIVKCHPPKNRDPKPDEISACTSNYLLNQIGLINPKIIVALGLVPSRFFFPEIKQMQDVHGTIRQKDGKSFLLLYHPIMSVYRPGLVPTMFRDFEQIKNLSN